MNSFYADGFSIYAGLTDAKIDFNTVNPVADENGNIVGEQRIIGQRIALSLPLAKELAQKLNEIIASYEEQFGPVLDLGEAREKIVKNGK